MALHVYHVMTEDASTYGVAATGKRDALIAVQDRLDRDESTARPISCSRVAVAGPTWSYGTVLRYT